MAVLSFKFARPARFMVEDLMYLPSSSGVMNLYHLGCPVFLKMYAALMLEFGGALFLRVAMFST